MAGYIIAQLEVTDPEAFEKYRERVPEIIARHGGRYLVRGGKLEVLEGEWPNPRLVVVAYDSFEAAKAFYHSEAYQEILPLRTAASVGNVIVVEGV